MKNNRAEKQKESEIQGNFSPCAVMRASDKTLTLFRTNIGNSDKKTLINSTETSKSFVFGKEGCN